MEAALRELGQPKCGPLGELRFMATDWRPTDHVLATGESAAQAATVAVDTLDALAAGWEPVMMKIDVEGFEANVIAGAPVCWQGNPCRPC